MTGLELLLALLLVCAVVALVRYERSREDGPARPFCPFCGAEAPGPAWLRQHVEAMHPELFEDEQPQERRLAAWAERTGQR